MPTLDVSQNWTLPLNTETVQYYRKTSEGVFAVAATVEDCKRRAVNKEDLEGEGILASQATIWHLWRDKLPTVSGQKIQPKRGDKIETVVGTDEEPEIWIVHSVRVQSMNQRYRCICTKKV